MEIKFESLNAIDFSRFARPTPSDYPTGRYSGTISAVEPQTKDSKGNFTLRLRVQTTVDQEPGKPTLRVNDLVSFVGPNGFMWAGANVFCDLMAIAGHDRDSIYASCKALANALESADAAAVRSTFTEIAFNASVLPGTRVAPFITWTDDGQYANVKGSKAAPSYVSAANESDPSASFTGDDVDSPTEQPNRRAKRTLVKGRR